MRDATPSLREVQAEYRESVGPILVDAGGANPGTVGTAFDVWLHLQATARPALPVAYAGAAITGRRVAAAFEDLLDTLGPAPVRGDGPVERPWSAPHAASDERDLLRLCWATALLVEVFRTGTVMPGSALDGLPSRGRVDLLGLAPETAVDELAALAALARERLLPGLRDLSGSGPTRLGPTFAGSRLMAADADLVVGKTLFEVKTTLGRKVPGGRKAALDGLVLHQVLGYVLHDLDDAHGIRSVALYQARYGHVAVWQLGPLLERLAGRPVDLAALRGDWGRLLQADDGSGR